MQFDLKNEELLNYYHSLPPHIKKQLKNCDAHISTVGELMLIAEHYNMQQEVPNELQ